MIIVRRLVWDPGNIAHIARHRVVPEEVLEVCQGKHVVREGYQNRIILIGSTKARRLLAIVLDAEGPGAYYPVTSRPASRRERRIYLNEQEEAS